MGGIRKKKRFTRTLTGFLLAGVLGFSCPGVESLAEGISQVWEVQAAKSGSRGEMQDTGQDSTWKIQVAAKENVQESGTATVASTDNASFTWKKRGSKRYCYKNGKKLTGFQQVNGNYYYFGSKGAMCTGWQFVGNHYRYFAGKSGKMRVNTTVQGRKIDKNGIWTPVVVLDPGHTGVVVGGYEPLGPGSSEKKAKDTSGTEGVVTKVAEYKLTLKVAKQLSSRLKKQGCKVVMTRTNSKGALSCVQRAKIANKAKADAYLRIHANGSSLSSANGAMTICVTRSNRYVSSKLYKKSYALSKAVLDSYVKATGCKKEYIWETDSMTGNNWSKVPTTLIEMGYMSNPSEDRKMQTKAYQKKMVKGMADGIQAYFLGRG